ncbi:MAG TPA: nitroreductase/quinone reductase family protein [Phototrophicaceae bacterium]|jgi:deazaflavin-dependent oxidoreductase (nitroreductase family)|nr:nitroreductase/quinone reductase family protein [Phototrophicaceae bacterium]
MTTTSYPYYQRPSHLRTGVINPILRFLVLRFGIDSSSEQDFMRILRVAGRKSGRLYDVPVRIVVMDGQRYILSMLGEAQWVRNLRAIATADLVVGKTVESIRPYEVLGDDKIRFFEWYCQHPQLAMRARFVFGVNPRHLTSADLNRMVEQFPVFRLASTSASQRPLF